MKKFGLFSATLVLLSGSIQGGILLNEDFGYADGALTTVGSDNWATHSGTAGQIMVSSGSISLNDVDSEDVNSSLGTTFTTGSVYSSLDFSVTAGAQVSGGDYEYFFHFGDAGFGYVSRVDVVAPTGAGDFSLGLGNTSTAELSWATDLTFGVTYTLVTEYNRDSGNSALWINPVNVGSTSIVTTNPSTSDVSRVFFRQSGSSANETITIDNLVVGTTFNDVVPVPEASTIAFILGGLVFGFVAWRRRK